LSHLYLKALVHPGKWDFFNQMFAGFWRGYQDEFAFRPFLSLIGNGIAHLGACLMARADGTSPAPYLDEQTKNAARRLGRRILLEHLFDWTEVVGCLHEECERLAVRE
jgi:5-methylthioribose kinase